MKTNHLSLLLKHKSRIVAILLSILLVAAMFPALVLAESEGITQEITGSSEQEESLATEASDANGLSEESTEDETEESLLSSVETQTSASDAEEEEDAAEEMSPMPEDTQPRQSSSSLPEEAKLRITMVTALRRMGFEYTATADVYVDWGDGNPVVYTSGSTCNVSGDGTIRIYCSGDITRLICYDNQLTRLDVTHNTALTHLNCQRNSLTELDVTQNTSLTSLYCDDNRLTELDVTQNTALTTFYCNNNQLTEFDVIKNTSLTDLNCQCNLLTELDVTNNTSLTELDCAGNKLTELDVTKNTLLTYLECAGNELTELDVTNNTALTSLDCFDNKLTELDVTNNTALIALYCNDNQLNVLDISNNAELIYLSCSRNKLTELNVRNCPYITHLLCENNRLTSLDITGNSELTSLICSNNELTSLDVTNNTKIFHIECNNNPLTFSSMTAVDSLVNRNDIALIYYIQAPVILPTSIEAGETIDLSSEWNAHGKETVYRWYDYAGNTVTPTTSEQGKFTFDGSFVGKALYCKMTNEALPELTLETTEIRVTEAGDPGTIPEERGFGLPQIIMTTTAAFMSFDYEASSGVYVDWGDGVPTKYSKYSTCNVLGEIKVYCSREITELWVMDSGINKLDVTNCIALTGLHCSGNQLTELDVTQNTALTELYCSDNQLTEIDVSNNAALETLWCVDNQLIKLDVSQNPTLEALLCGSNRLTFSSVIVASSATEFAFGNSEQAEVPLPTVIKAGGTVDLSSEWNAHGKETVYKWYDNKGNVVTPTASEQGKFTFDDSFIGKKLYCLMTNESLPALTLRTTPVEIRSAADTAEQDLNVVDDENADAQAELSEDIDVVDENGFDYIGDLKLVIGNVSQNTKKTVFEAVEAYNKAFRASDNNYALYDISLRDENNKKVEIENGRILITLKVPDNLQGNNKDYTFKLYHYSEASDKLEEIAITLSNGNSHYSFYADEFSPFILIYYKTAASGNSGNSSHSVNTGDDSSVDIASAVNLFLFAALVAYYALYVRKRRVCNSMDV